jgi:hypothetical protein
MTDSGDLVTAAVVRERLTTLGQFVYLCNAEDGPHHAVSRELVQDCMWHGESCECWSVLVDPYSLAMLIADADDQSGRTVEGGK